MAVSVSARVARAVNVINYQALARDRVLAIKQQLPRDVRCNLVFRPTKKKKKKKNGERKEKQQEEKQHNGNESLVGSFVVSV